MAHIQEFIAVDNLAHEHSSTHSGEVTNQVLTSSSSTFLKEVFDVKSYDPILASKMALVNQAIDDIGMTSFQWKLFFLNGFGYAVDSLLVVCQSIANPAVIKEYGSPNKHVAWISLASQLGLLVGAMVWGFSADIVGRKFAFNTSLLFSAVFVLIAGAMPSYASFAVVVALYSAGAGGNYILDATNFLEFLPSSHAFLVTFLAVWWSIGYMTTGFLAWAFMSNFSCTPDALPGTCSRDDNMGWRYLHFTCGAIVLVMALIRVLLFKMVQTPRWLLSQNREEEVIVILNNMATKHNRSHTLTLHPLQAQGAVAHTNKSIWSSFRLKMHFKGLFQTKRLAWSTSLTIANWFVIGFISPLYWVFLPFYLQSRAVSFGTSSNYLTWRDYSINQSAGLLGPVIAAVLVETKFLGRRGTLAIGAALTMIFQFGYTQIRDETENVGVSAAISAVGNIYYGTIYAYTPEILPSAHRATGYGLCVVANRIGGIFGVLVGGYANVETTAPLFICASLSGLLVILSLLLPFESRGKRTQ